MADLGVSAGAMADRIEALTGITTAGNALGFLNDGYRRVLSGKDPRDSTTHIWSFLRIFAKFQLLTGDFDYDLPADYGGIISPFTYEFPQSTKHSGTGATVSTKTLTSSGGTGEDWETDVAVGDTVTLSVGTGTLTAADYIVASITDDDNIVLTEAPGDDTTITYTIQATASFATNRRRIRRSSIDKIFESQRDFSDNDIPTMYSIAPKTFVVATGQRWQVYFARTPSTIVNGNRVQYIYRALADALTDSNTVFPMGGPLLANVILEAGLSEASRKEEADSPHEAFFREGMVAAIDADVLLFDDGTEAPSLDDEPTGMDDGPGPSWL